MNSKIFIGALVMLLPIAMAEAAGARESGKALRVITVRDTDSQHGWLGVSIEEVTKRLAHRRDLKTDRGAYVNRVEEESPADSAGIKEGDVIIKFDEKPIDNSDDLLREVRKTKPGTDLSIVVMRGNDKKTMRVTIGRIQERREVRPFAFGPHGMHMWGGSTMYGLSLLELNSQLGEYFEAPNGKGVLVEKVKKNSAGEKAGFKAGDVITKVGKETIADEGDVWSALDEYKDGEKAEFEILRKGMKKTLTLVVEEQDRGPSFHFKFDRRPHSEDLDDFDIDVVPPKDMDKLYRERHRLRFDMESLKRELERIPEQIQRGLKELQEKLRQEFNRPRNVRGTPNAQPAPDGSVKSS
jgi:membrane-associated protease RseP (regulator of RpoE activity)